MRTNDAETSKSANIIRKLQKDPASPSRDVGLPSVAQTSQRSDLMDAAYYEDMAGRLYGLVIRLSDRLPDDQVRWLHHVTEVGEYDLALEDMARMLTFGQIMITDQEREDMLALAHQMEMDNRVSDALRTCPRTELQTTSARTSRCNSSCRNPLRRGYPKYAPCR